MCSSVSFPRTIMSASLAISNLRSKIKGEPGENIPVQKEIRPCVSIVRSLEETVGEIPVFPNKLELVNEVPKLEQLRSPKGILVSQNLIDGNLVADQRATTEMLTHMRLGKECTYHAAS